MLSSLAFCLLLIIGAAPAQSNDKPQVIFFGGWGATQEDMRTWEARVRSDLEYGQRYLFTGVPYPKGAGWREGEVLRPQSAKSLIEHYVQLVQKNPQREFVLVAHSSAGELVNAIGHRLPRSSRVKVVLLDGFNAAVHVQNKFPTICYYASSSMSQCRQRIAGPTVGCKQGKAGNMCRHFKMLNSSIGASARLAEGYVGNFKPNLNWLTQIRGESSTTAKTENSASSGTPGAR